MADIEKIVNNMQKLEEEQQKLNELEQEEEELDQTADIADSAVYDHFAEEYNILKEIDDSIDTLYDQIKEQYDAMLNWVINSDSADKHKISEDTNGNHSGSLVTTGKYSNDKINNIYDLEGNLFEWTLEAMGEVDRTIRGGSFLVGMPSNRSTAVATYNSPEYFGSRLTLYIK